MALDVEFLWFEDCPSHEDAFEMLQDVLAELDADADIQRRKVETEEQVEAFNFPGSPTIRVNGEDIDPEGAASLPNALTCRVYRREDGRPSPLPSREQVRTAVQRALANEQQSSTS